MKRPSPVTAGPVVHRDRYSEPWYRQVRPTSIGVSLPGNTAITRGPAEESGSETSNHATVLPSRLAAMVRRRAKSTREREPEASVARVRTVPLDRSYRA